MKVLKWLGAIVVSLVVGILLMDTFGGYLFDGPIGPIPGGAFQGSVSAELNPDWSGVEEVIELEIRPTKPWSLSTWAAVVDGELYVPSAKGAQRRWPKVVLDDPRIRLRSGGKIYERRLERVTDEELMVRIRTRLGERYELDGDPTETDDGLWIFHVVAR
jgi:hypothetical protein